MWPKSKIQWRIRYRNRSSSTVGWLIQSINKSFKWAQGIDEDDAPTMSIRNNRSPTALDNQDTDSPFCFIAMTMSGEETEVLCDFEMKIPIDPHFCHHSPLFTQPTCIWITFPNALKCMNCVQKMYTPILQRQLVWWRREVWTNKKTFTIF